jgi:predicted nucleotidyltransferase
MSVPKEVLAADPGLDDWAILVGYRGSVAHGTWLPSDDPDSVDDKDLMAFCVPNRDLFLGLRNYGSRGTKEIVRDIASPVMTRWDVVIYEIRKAISLLEKGNPNVLSMLWLPEGLFTKLTPAGSLLVESRELFVGKHVYNAYVGYARSQLSKMERGAFKGYMGEKRRALVEQHGYDTKNAAHLIRLLRQGIEFLSTGDLIVQRHDASALIDIRRGAWGLDRVKKEADALFAQANDALIHSPLPVKPNSDAINRLCREIVEAAWGERGEA